jgi:hypothetical protein
MGAVVFDDRLHVDIQVGVDATDDGAVSFYDCHCHPCSPLVKGWRGRPVKEVTVISALLEQDGPSPLWNGARRFYGPKPGRQDNVIPLSESQAKISVCSTVVRSNR